jgi:hypothetical protein
MRNCLAALVVASAISGIALPGPASAQIAPAELRGKSVTATWTENRMQRTGDQKEFVPRSFSQTLSVYISSEGRAFTKRTVVNTNGKRKLTGSASTVGENAGGGQVSQLRGHTLTVMTRFEGGARMARIDFDQSFSSCTATVILGRENGGGVARGRALDNGKPLEIASTTVSGTSCSLQNGNVFGQ